MDTQRDRGRGGGGGGGGGGRIWREGGARICTLEFRLSLMLEKKSGCATQL